MRSSFAEELEVERKGSKMAEVVDEKTGAPKGVEKAEVAAETMRIEPNVREWKPIEKAKSHKHLSVPGRSCIR